MNRGSDSDGGFGERYEGPEAALTRAGVTELPKRRTIQITIGETERVVDEIEASLIASGRGLYRRGGAIVATGFDRMQTWDGKAVEVQIIEERGDYALLEDIEAVADFVRVDSLARIFSAPM